MSRAFWYEVKRMAPDILMAKWRVNVKTIMKGLG